MPHRRKTALLLALVVSLVAGLAAIVLQEDVREKLGDSYYVVTLSIIGCILLVLSGYLWDRTVWARLRALGSRVESIKSDTDSPFDLVAAASETNQDEIIGLARQIERMARSVQRVDASYRGIVEDQFDLICRYKPDQKLTFVNGAYCRFYGRRRPELFGQPFHGLATSSRVPWSSDPAVQTYEQEIPAADGASTWLQWVVREFHDGHGQLVEYQAVGHDITARKQAETALLRAKEAAEAANRAKGEFLAIVSHEIRNPISGVLGFANILRDTPLTPEQLEYVNLIHHSGDTLLVLINDLLDFSKIEAGKIELEAEPYSPRRAVDEVLAFFRPKARLVGLTLESVLAPDVPPTVVGDVYRLRQILINLVGNAVKFTRQGGVTVRVESIATGAPFDQARLQFTVSDTGIGIAPEKIGQLFQPYVQADASTTRQYGGTGLGLIISKRLSELMGGRIHVESTPGVGSKFIFDLRAGAVRAAPPQAGHNAPAFLRPAPSPQN
ncbi:MAG: PAS domain S-box protein [Opitutae bacterium]|nr:PAS domain S-box protein [Opitutae bacterium]